MSFTHIGASTPLIDANTLDNGSAVYLTERLATNKRLVINKEWIENYVLPAITSGSGTKSVWIGFEREFQPPDWSNGVFLSDFNASYEFRCNDVLRAAGKFRISRHSSGSEQGSVDVGSLTEAQHDIAFINTNQADGGLKIGAVLASENHDLSTLV